MENNEPEKQNFKFPERWGICAIILLPFLFFVSAIAYITEFSSFKQYLISCGVLSVVIWLYYDVIKIFELVENVVRDEKTLKLLHAEKEKNKRLEERVMEGQQEIENIKKLVEDTVENIKDVVIKTTKKIIEDKEKTFRKDMIEATEETDEIIKENTRLKEENERLKKEKGIR